MGWDSNSITQLRSRLGLSKIYAAALLSKAGSVESNGWGWIAR